MQKRVCGLAAALLLGPCCAVAADEPSAARVMDLTDAVAVAYDRNPEYLNLRDGIALAKLDLESARAAFRSRLVSSVASDARSGADTGSQYSVGLVKDLESGSRLSGGFNTSSFDNSTLSEIQFGYSRPLFGDGDIDGRLRLDWARFEVAKRQRLFDVGAEELIVQVSRSFFTLVQNKQSLQLASAALDLAGTLNLSTRARYNAGQASELDLNRSELNLAQASQQREEASQQVVQSREDLLYLLGLRPDSQVRFSDSLPEIDEFGVPRTLSPDLISQALSKRPEIINKTEELRLYSQLIEGLADTDPPVELSLTYSLVGRGDGFDDSLEFDDHRVGIGLTTSTSLGYSHRENRARRENLEYYRLRREFQRLERDFTNRIRRAGRDRLRSARNREMARESVAFAEKQHQLVNLHYQQGRANTVDILDAQTELAQARLQLLIARVNALVAEIDYQKSLGTLKDSWLVRE